MKLLQALELLKQPVPEPASTLQVYLECGFTPLHLKTLLAAHLRLQFPNNTVEIQTGLFGDLAGNLERLQPSPGSMGCVVIEWPDLDPRLGIRSLGGWRSVDVEDLLNSARQNIQRLVGAIKELERQVPVYVSTPTLPLPPLFATKGIQAHRCECELRELVASLAALLSACKRTKLAGCQRIDELSPLAQRFDPKSDINTGFPYTLEHASTMGELLALLIRDKSPKKGLITDLDDTLWAGIVGEIGAEGVSWSGSGRSHAHGLYQRFLASLADAGVLVAIASKNDPAIVEKALTRADLLLSSEIIFPLEVNWGLKSESVHRILRQWNIAPEDVIFVDDSPMELAEVHAAFPQLECVLFPKADAAAVWNLLRQLRELFGKSAVSTEDEIRMQSIRSSAEIRNALEAPGSSADDLLRHAEAKITFSLTANADDRRAFELINKTNQFNLNGRRYTEAEWLSFLQDPTSFLLTADYEDKYGALGKIAVVLGRTDGSKLFVNSWVMSCRAFSRRIEHQCLRYLFETARIDEIVFDYTPTPKNGPLQDFFTSAVGTSPSPGLSLFKDAFAASTPPLFQRIMEAADPTEAGPFAAVAPAEAATGVR